MSAPTADKNILAFSLFKQTLGAALFDISSCEVHILEVQVDVDFKMSTVSRKNAWQGL